MLVNTSGQVTGTMDKLAAHKIGSLHRAFSVFIFNQEGQLLLQQRAANKYHSGGLWTNTCCSHPRLGEMTGVAANRRLWEEMGMTSELTEVFQFTYRHQFLNGMIEYEYDHVFLGICDEEPKPDPTEVAGFRYIDPDVLMAELDNQPENYTPWFKIAFNRVLESHQQIFCL